jgi:hypothetical protein
MVKKYWMSEIGKWKMEMFRRPAARRLIRSDESFAILTTSNHNARQRSSTKIEKFGAVMNDVAIRDENVYCFGVGCWLLTVLPRKR